MTSSNKSPLQITILSEEFLGDARHFLKDCVDEAKLGWLDEAIAMGLGHKTKASLQAAIREVTRIGNTTEQPLIVTVDEEAFNARMADFGVTIAKGMFSWNMLEVLKIASARSTALMYRNGRSVPVVGVEGLAVKRNAAGRISDTVVVDQDVLDEHLAEQELRELTQGDDALAASWAHMQESRGWR